MAFDWYGFLELARTLQAQAGGTLAQEPALRTAVSRTYYAAFGHAHRYACDYLGFVPRSKPEERSQDHGRLRAHLRRRRYGVAVRLAQLRDWRNACDYGEDLAGLDLALVTPTAVAAAEYVFQSLQPPSGP